MPRDRTGVSRGHSRREETSPAKKKENRERLTPPKGRTLKKGRTSMSSQDMINPYGGVRTGRVMESFDPNERLLVCQRAVGEHPLPGYGL
jgi:hypothetical protein